MILNKNFRNPHISHIHWLKFFKLRFLLTFSAIFLLSSTRDFAIQNNIDLNKLCSSVNEIYYSFDAQKIRNLIKETDKYIESNPKVYYGYYFNGILRYCLGRVIYNDDSDAAYDYFDSSQGMFEKAWGINKNPEVLAMISATYGKKSALSPLRSIFFGQKAKNRIYDAYNLDSNNTKIILVAATHLMHVPSIYGGDRKRARQMLDKCLILNRQKKDNKLYELTWADNAEIYAYLAQIDILEEKYDSARENMKKALEIKPDYGFVKIDLENQIKEAKK